MFSQSKLISSYLHSGFLLFGNSAASVIFRDAQGLNVANFTGPLAISSLCWNSYPNKFCTPAKTKLNYIRVYCQICQIYLSQKN